MPRNKLFFFVIIIIHCVNKILHCIQSLFMCIVKSINGLILPQLLVQKDSIYLFVAGKFIAVSLLTDKARSLAI